jgi:hypothetical protein
MAIIVVGGSGRGAGKTALVCALIAAMPEFRWNAVKITSHDCGQSAPVWEETQAGQGSDMARYLAAGAARAFLATPLVQPQTSEPDLAPVLDELWPHFGRGSNFIFESNHVVHYVRADGCFMIHALPQRELPLPARKPSFFAALGHADAMVTWSHPAWSHMDRTMPGELCLPGQQAKPIFHLADFDRIAPQMESWLRQRLGQPSWVL